MSAVTSSTYRTATTPFSGAGLEVFKFVRCSSRSSSSVSGTQGPLLKLGNGAASSRWSVRCFPGKEARMLAFCSAIDELYKALRNLQPAALGPDLSALGGIDDIVKV